MSAAHAADTAAAAHVFVDALDDTIELEGPERHHLARVRRLRAGEHVTGSDGDGSWRLYEVTAASPDQLALGAITASTCEPPPATRIVLAFAPTKGGGTERVVQHATELGVDELRPLVTRRTVVRWDHERETAAAARLERVARAAAAQCFRSRLPVVGPAVTLRELSTRGGLVVATRVGERRPELPIGPEWVLAVGPEGGFAPEELVGAESAPRLALGDHVLRAETAAIVGCSVLARFRGT